LQTYGAERLRALAIRGVSRATAEAPQGWIPDPGSALERIVLGDRIVHIPDVVATKAYRSGVSSRLKLVELTGARTGLWIGYRAAGGYQQKQQHHQSGRHGPLPRRRLGVWHLRQPKPRTTIARTLQIFRIEYTDRRPGRSGRSFLGAGRAVSPTKPERQRLVSKAVLSRIQPLRW